VHYQWRPWKVYSLSNSLISSSTLNRTGDNTHQSVLFGCIALLRAWLKPIESNADRVARSVSPSIALQKEQNRLHGSWCRYDFDSGAPRGACINWSTQRRTLMHTSEPSVYGGDAPYVKLLWPLFFGYAHLLSHTDTSRFEPNILLRAFRTIQLSSYWLENATSPALPCFITISSIALLTTHDLPITVNPYFFIFYGAVRCMLVFLPFVSQQQISGVFRWMCRDDTGACR